MFERRGDAQLVTCTEHPGRVDSGEPTNALGRPRSVLTEREQESELTLSPDSRWDVRPTERQQDVLELLTRGYCNKEIAAVLEITEPTVKFHVSRLLHEFGASNRTALTRLWADRRRSAEEEN